MQKKNIAKKINRKNILTENKIKLKKIKWKRKMSKKNN